MIDSDLNQKLNDTVKESRSLQEELAETNKGIIALTMELHQAEEKYRSILETVENAIITISENGIIETFNPSFKRLFRFGENEIIEGNIDSFLINPDNKENKSAFREYLNQKRLTISNSQLEREALGVRRDGTLFPIDFSVGKVVVNNKKIFTLIIRDITERKKAEEHFRLMAKIFESSINAIVITDINAKIIDVNPGFTEITGYSKEEVLGKNPNMMKSGRHKHEYYKDMWQTLLKTGKWNGEIWDRRKNGELYPKWLFINVVKDDKGDAKHYVGISSDITIAKNAETKLRRLAHYDVLTDLPNRALFIERLKWALSQLGRNKKLLSLLFLDLDRFKIINDTLGHQAGDKLLVEVSRRMKKCVRETDTVARMGGDEFTVIMSNIANMDDAALCAQKIIDGLSLPFSLDNHEVFVTLSIGIAIAPSDGEDAETLIKNADTAMYHAKELGKENYQFYSEEMNLRTLERLELEAKLHRALEREEFLLHYQPRVDISTGSIVGAEALIRWQHPQFGMIHPKKFIPLAESTGLIIPIGEWVLKKACQQAQEWKLKGYPPVRIAVNLSSIQFKRADLQNVVERVLKETGIDPNYLELELTENVVMENVNSTIVTLNKLKNMGIMLTIDDFGTGYSSFSYLKKFPIDMLKIDLSFIRDIATNPDDVAIVSSIIAMAHQLRLKVTAEGVEDEEQLSIIRAKKCDEVQGFYFGHPVSAEKFTEMLKKRR